MPATDVPDPDLTPGARFSVGVGRICRPGYASGARDVSEADKAAVYARYGIPWVPYAHEVDHLISLELGGSNAIRNLWPEPYAGRWGARTKDVLENRLHDMVCAGELSLRAAQRQEATDWVRAYLRYIGRPPGRGDNGGSTSAGGYYASSYPSATTIYCANDPAWHTLSRDYRVHFATLEAALARFPSYHVHQPC
ncbi:MAG: HNH endonuclease signature motif containing protein [Actinomycetota bacterium]